MDLLSSLIQTNKPVVIELGEVKTLCGTAGGLPSRVETKLALHNKSYHLSEFTQIRTTQIDQGKWKSILYKLVYDLVFSHLLIQPKDKTVVLMESLMGSNLLRELVVEVLFTKFLVPKVALIPSQSAAIFAAGSTSGLVIDCGYNETVLVPVVNRLVVTSGLHTFNTGVKHIHTKLNELLMSYDSVYVPLQQRQAATAVAWGKLTAPLEYTSMDALSRAVAFFPPLGTAEVEAQEFDPFQARGDLRLRIRRGIGGKAASSLFEQDEERNTLAMAVNSDVRRTIASKILLTGGAACIPGFAARLVAELDKALESPRFCSLAHLKGTFATLQQSKFQPDELGWVGGSILATADKQLIASEVTREEYLAHKSVPDWTSLAKKAPTSTLPKAASATAL